MSDSPRTAAALIIGNELLSGKVQEQNLLVLARSLRAVGIALRRVVMVPDCVPTIADEVRLLAASFDEVFTSGGVGPTHDDVTIDAVAAAFETQVETHPALAAMIGDHLGDRLHPGHLRMARVPHGSVLVATPDGKWPTIRIKNVWVLPGVPEIFRLRMPAIKQELAGATPFVSRSVSTRLDEGRLVPLLDSVVDRFPTVDVGSYPKYGGADYRTLITFDGLDADEVSRALDAFVELLPEGEPLSVA